MSTVFPDAFAAAFAAGVGLGFIILVWSLTVERCISFVRKLTRIGEDV